METDLHPTPSPKERFNEVTFTFLINLLLLTLLGLTLYSPSWFRFSLLESPRLQQAAGTNASTFLYVAIGLGVLGFLLSMIWRPEKRLVTIVLCLINIIVIALISLLLLGLLSSFRFNDFPSAAPKIVLIIAVLAAGYLNVRTLIYLDILGAITGGKRD